MVPIEVVMKIIPKILTGNFIVGPNGFCKHNVNTNDWYTIHWFPGYGLTTMRIVDGQKTYKVRFRPLAKFLLRWS